jgi:putative hydrolase of the HAD superfamily
MGDAAMPPRGRPIRAVLFDAVGTLLAPRPSAAEAYRAAGRRFGCDLPLDEVHRRFHAAFARQEAVDAVDPFRRTSDARERDRWRTIVAEVLPEVADTEGLFGSLWDHFAQAQNWQLFPDVAGCWQELAARGLVLGVASNFDDRLPGLCRAMPPLDGCESIFVSSRLGFRKPGAGFFQAIEAALDLPPRAILMVGDDLANDYHGARAAGWDAIHLARGGRAEVPVEASLADLTRLADRLEGWMKD